jgi:tetratricopeptide (TPR) repeat protein
MKCLCLPDGNGAATVVDHLRLFRNHPQVRWDFRVHEQILPALRKIGAAVRWSEVVVHHTGYQDPALRKRKLQRDLRLLQLEQFEQPDHPFTLFNLGSVYQELGRIEEALEMFRGSLNRSTPKDSIVRKLYATITQCHRALGQKEEALAACRSGLALFADDVELLFQEGVTLRELGDIAAAVNCWERCLQTSPGTHFASVNTGLRGHITRHNLAVAFCELGRPGDAESQWKTALTERAHYEPAWRGLLGLYLEQKRWAQVDELAREVEAKPLGGLEAAGVRGRLHLARKEFSAARQVLEYSIQRWPQALEPRVLLSHALLQEAKDWKAAEGTLRGILALDPHHTEAKHNLALLLQQQTSA